MTSKSKKAISTSVYKATEHKAKPSKEKHVRAIILRSFNKDGSVEEIIRCLAKRLEKQNYAVVLKCLMIFHRCFRDGDASFIEAMKTRSNQVFALRHFSATAPPNHMLTVFVKKYAKYLEEKVSVLRLLSFQFEKNKDAVKGLKPPKCFKTIPKLQSQLNALLNCKMRPQHVGNNQLIHRTYILLMKDSLSLYSMLNEGILQLLDMFWKMDRKNATRVLAIYKLFVKETDALIGLYEIGKTFVRQLPEIHKAETGIIESMEKYIDTLPGNDDDDDDKKKKSKPKKTTKKKEESASDSSDEELAEKEDEYEYSADEHNKSYEDSDKEAQSGEDSSSDAEPDEPEEQDWVKQYLNMPVAGASQTPANPFQNMYGPTGVGGTTQFAAPSFGPGAQNQIFTSGQGQPAYSQKAAGILSVFDSNPAPSPFQQQAAPNPFAAPSSNPFASTALVPSTTPSPFGAPQSAGIFGSTPSPFAVGATAGPFGSTSGVAGSGTGAGVFGSSAGVFGSSTATGAFGTGTSTAGAFGSGAGTAGSGAGVFGSGAGAPFGSGTGAGAFGSGNAAFSSGTGAPSPFAGVSASVGVGIGGQNSGAYFSATGSVGGATPNTFGGGSTSGAQPNPFGGGTTGGGNPFL